MYNSTTIKNLAIALEAVSRVGGSWSQIEVFDGITKLLNNEIKSAEEQNAKHITEPTPTSPSLTDEIPF